jgi:hypothetical protein
MRIENGVVILERKDCSCGDGTQAQEKWKVCPKCHGTGKRGSGRCRNCNAKGSWYRKKRPGYVAWYDHDDPVPCKSCGGNYKDFRAETWMDSADFSFLPVVVVRSDRRASWGEQHLGVGLGSCVDYGRHKKQSDEQIIADVKRAYLERAQICKAVNNKEEMLLAKRVLVLTSDMGYSVLGSWED